MMQNWKRNWLAVSKLRWGIWWILTRVLKNLKKVFIVDFLLGINLQALFLSSSPRNVSRTLVNIYHWKICNNRLLLLRDGSRTAATSKMERFVIIINGWKPLAIITKRCIMDVAAALDPPLCPWYLKILNR